MVSLFGPKVFNTPMGNWFISAVRGYRVILMTQMHGGQFFIIILMTLFVKYSKIYAK